MKRPKGVHCNFCKEPEHMVRDCPKAKYKDMMRAEELKKCKILMKILTKTPVVKTSQQRDQSDFQNKSSDVECDCV